jgi:hypothetical protein
MFQRFSLKMPFPCHFNGNLSVTHVFLANLHRAVKVAPPFPPQGCAGGGVVVALSSRGYGYGSEALRIRVKPYSRSSIISKAVWLAD